MSELAHTGGWTRSCLQERPHYAGHLERIEPTLSTRDETQHLEEDILEGVPPFSTSNPTPFYFQKPNFEPWSLDSCVDSDRGPAGLNSDEISVDLGPLCEQLNNLGRKVSPVCQITRVKCTYPLQANDRKYHPSPSRRLTQGRWDMVAANDEDAIDGMSKFSKLSWCDNKPTRLFRTQTSNRDEQLTWSRMGPPARKQTLDDENLAKDLPGGTEDADPPLRRDGARCLLSIKHRLLAFFMERFYTIFDQQWQLTTKTGPESSKEGSGRKKEQTGQSMKPCIDQKLGKRGMKRKSEQPSDDEKDDKSRRKNAAPGAQKPKSALERLACPLHKHNPEKFSVNTVHGIRYRACEGPGFTSVAQVKQHLRRVHPVPIQCERCWVQFDDDEKLARHTEPVDCEETPAQPDVMTRDKVELINGHGITWKDIFGFLFPGAPIPSQYYDTPYSSESKTTHSSDTDELHAYEKFSEQLLPLLVERRLQPRIEEQMRPILDSLLNEVRFCQSQIPAMYAQQKAENSGSRDLEVQSLGSAFETPPDLVAGRPLLAQDIVARVNTADRAGEDFQEILTKNTPVQVCSEPNHPKLVASPPDLDTTTNNAGHATIVPLSNKPEICYCWCHEADFQECGYCTQQTCDWSFRCNMSSALNFPSP